MQCDACGKKKATVHLTEIIDGQMAEMHICEDCAKERSVQMEQQFGLADLLAGLSDFGKQIKAEEKVKLQCPNCSLSYDDFRKFGRLGCSECYSSFRSHLTSLLKKIHGSGHHLGKAPLRFKEEIKTESLGKSSGGKEDSLQSLKNKLQQAILSEDFEQAAILRDKIRSLESKGESV
ncbi:MAG: UvrB/UvrC motif-containing protein [Candidatus Omnitrophica bacterium]|nr:UvrB/UvrC motif-containing protein [Candidatus Omnitrophota bacterium]